MEQKEYNIPKFRRFKKKTEGSFGICNESDHKTYNGSIPEVNAF